MATRSTPDASAGTIEEVADLIACNSPGKTPCFILLRWYRDRLLLADLFFTEEEGRASLNHGMIYEMTDFAVPPAVLAVM